MRSMCLDSHCRACAHLHAPTPSCVLGSIVAWLKLLQERELRRSLSHSFIDQPMAASKCLIINTNTYYEAFNERTC